MGWRLAAGGLGTCVSSWARSRAGQEEGIRSTSAIRRVAADRAETNVRVVRGRKGKNEKKGGEEEDREKKKSFSTKKTHLLL